MMKKLFFAVVAVAALTFASCGNKSNANAEAVDNAKVDTTALASEAELIYNALRAQLVKALDEGNAAKLTTALANFEAAYKTLANSGKLEDLRTFGVRIKNLISEQADNIKKVADGDVTISSLVSDIEGLPTSSDITLEDAKSAVSEKAVGMANEGLQKGADAAATVEEAENALKEDFANAKNTAKAAADEVENSANEVAKDAEKGMNNVKGDFEKAKQGIEKAAKKVEKDTNKTINDIKGQTK